MGAAGFSQGCVLLGGFQGSCKVFIRHSPEGSPVSHLWANRYLQSNMTKQKVILAYRVFGGVCSPRDVQALTVTFGHERKSFPGPHTCHVSVTIREPPSTVQLRTGPSSQSRIKFAAAGIPNGCNISQILVQMAKTTKWLGR